MRFTLALGLALGLAATVPAAAQKLDLRTLKCDEFIKQDKDFHGQILMWLSAYSMAEDDDPVIDFDQIIATGQKLGRTCAQNPASTVMAAYEQASK
ncbi:HdeA/HdeB family chaperone [Enterovirga sp.]|jgi:hypothetical protein|uniref:HdeA/HdeB family chaperone n=1 Tax=Enterovirga sp. TaxID=2026350 RepID=UPI00263A3419|nr:HdeA/HdeB family chaperone [Enterovirga sp.]MDB5591734.1 hypothetical protein [Enterovirga sp.]